MNTIRGRAVHGLFAALAAMILLPAAAAAHSFGTPYVLPVPLWIYAYGSAATLILTFLVLGLFASAPELASSAAAEQGFSVPADMGNQAPTAASFPSQPAVAWARLPPPLVRGLRTGATACLLTTIATGLFGNYDAADNLGMTLFWVVFLMGFTYVTLVVGDIFAFANPWRSSVILLEQLAGRRWRSHFRYPSWLAHWPALVFYFGLIWLELFGKATPLALSLILIGYTAITVLGAWMFGREYWFAKAELFSVFFCLVGKLAPIAYRREPGSAGWQVALRPPLAGLLDGRVSHVSLALFILFMLSSTTYDGIQDTQLWISFYWSNAMAVLHPLYGDDLGRAQVLLMGWFLIYRQAGLILLLFCYFIIYVAVLLVAKLLTRTARPLQQLVLDFALSLIPIAVAYNFTHYFPFVFVQLYDLPRLLSNPLGFGWELFELAAGRRRVLLDMGVIWHVQVAVLLLGHLASVYLSHKRARQVFPQKWQANLSQAPLLVLMVFYTLFGLWILSLPIAAGMD